MDATTLILAAVDPATFIPVLARVGGVVTFFPLIGAQLVPVRARVLLALGLAWAIRPYVPVIALDSDTALFTGVSIIAGELLVGAAMGFTAQAALAAFETAGQFLGFQMGLTLSSIIDPLSGEQTSSVSVFYRLIAGTIYILLDAHHAFLLAMRESYSWVGAGLAAPGASFAEGVTAVTAGLLVLAVRIAAPALLILFLMDIALLLAARALPQVNMLILGYPVKTAIGLLAMAAGVSTLPRLVGLSLETALRQARGLAGSLSGAF